MTDVVTVDARGLTCPQPVLQTKRALEESQGVPLRVLVDNDVSRENVTRFARNLGCAVEVRDYGDQFEITINRRGELSLAVKDLTASRIPQAQPLEAKNVVYVGNNCMGKGDDHLGAKLMRGFLRTWLDVSPKPWRMIFINSGVNLTTADDEAVEAIALLEEKGVEILSCGACLQHYGLEGKLRVGKVTNMYEVIESLNSAHKVISPD
jgi:selenium metabolism protein YedF